MINRVVGMHFSPRGGTATITEQIVGILANELSDMVGSEVCCESFDMLRKPDCRPAFDKDTVAVIGMPVRIGKLPMPAIKLLKEISGSGAMTIAVVSYGTRSYGDALYELYHLSEDSGFKVIGAGAFVSKHKGVRDVSLVRPNREDLDAIGAFTDAAMGKLRRLSGSQIESLRIKPAPIDICGKLPTHRISTISPSAAALAENILERVCVKKRDIEWYL